MNPGYDFPHPNDVPSPNESRITSIHDQSTVGIGLSKNIIVLHSDDHQHALKEIDASASAVANSIDEVVKILQYTSTNKI